MFSWSVGFNPLRAFQEWASPGWVHHAVFLDKTLDSNKPHSSNNYITFGGLGDTHTCKNKTLVFNREDHFHFHRFCLFYFFLRFFLVRHRRNLAILLKIRATFRPDSAEVTANSNTLDVFQCTKPTTIKMAGPTLVSTIIPMHCRVLLISRALNNINSN